MSVAEGEAKPAGSVVPEVDFELGEDVSQQNRERELAWATAKLEGREQLSARETMIKSVCLWFAR